MHITNGVTSIASPSVAVVRIVTTVSPSWVAWHEIDILSRQPPDG
jgi:hypothetical protein